MQVFAANRRNWNLPHQPCHSTTGHVPTGSSLEHCSAESRRFCEVFCLRKNSFQLKCFYKTATIPTQNSTRAGMGNTTPALCKKEKKWFCLTKRVWQQGHASGKKKQCGDTAGGLVGLCNNSACAEQFRLTELLGKFVQRSLPALQNPQARSAPAAERSNRRSPPRAAGPPLTSAPPPNPGRFDELLICPPTETVRGRECTPCPGESLQMRPALEEPSTRSVPLLLNWLRSAGSPGCRPLPEGKGKHHPHTWDFVENCQIFQL